jgi:predicted RNase H-like HicB family nuclease
LQIHALIERDGEFYSALCLELDVASQGETVEEAKANLQEAIELYLEEVYESEIEEEFIPRPAPMEYWLRYFVVEAKEIGARIKNHEMPLIRINEVVYG